MATYTDNLKLKKPDNEDFYNVQDFNDNMDILDDKLKTTSDDINNQNNLIEQHINSNSNPHSVTAEQVGAAASLHTHSTSDITSGTLSIQRGGTGADSADGALSNLGIKAISVKFTPDQSNGLGFTGSIKAVPAWGIVFMEGSIKSDSLAANSGFTLGTVPSTYASKNVKYTPLSSSTGKIHISGQKIIINTDSSVSANELIAVSGFWYYS